MNDRITKKPIKIEVDDAGYGNFVGGLVIGGYAPEIDEYHGINISVDIVNKTEDVNEEVVLAVRKILRKFSKYNINEIYMCQSNLFDRTAEYIAEKRKKIKLWRGQIEGQLQELVEGHFIQTLIDLGLPGYIKFYLKMIGKNKNLGYRSLNNFCTNYIKIDMCNRLKICKQNNKLFKNIKKIELLSTIVRNRSRSKKRLCYNCGRYIRNKEIRRFYEKNKKNYFYTHISC